MNSQANDLLIWNQSATGNYTVRSTYHLLMKKIICNNALKVEGNWSLLWKLQIPPKVKQFLWNTLRGCLPTRTHLQQKGVQFTCLCEYCKLTLRMNDTFFFSGSRYFERWQAYGTSSIFICEDQILQLTWSSLCWKSFQWRLETYLLSLFCAFGKCEMREFGNGWARLQQYPLCNVCNIFMNGQLFETKLETTRNIMFINPNIDFNWNKPPLGSFKINVDAAILKKESLVLEWFSVTEKDTLWRLKKWLHKEIQTQRRLRREHFLQAIQWSTHGSSANHIWSGL